MTLFVTDFSEYATENPPSDWTERWSVDSASPTVETYSGGIGGKALNINVAASARYAISWDDIGSPTDVEVLIKTKVASTTGGSRRIYIRGAGASGAETAYFLQNIFADSAWKIQLFKYNAGASTQIGLSVGHSLGTTTAWWIRFRISGTSIKIKIWETLSAEPARWLIETTDSTLSSGGWVGVGCYSTEQTVDYIAAETSSGSWPIPVPSGIEDFKLDLAVQGYAFDNFKMLLDVSAGYWLEDFKLNLDVVAQIIDSFKMLLEVGLNKLDDFMMLLELTDGTVFDNFAMLLDVVDGTVFDNFKMDLSVVSATPAFRSVTAHRVSSVLHEIV